MNKNLKTLLVLPFVLAVMAACSEPTTPAGSWSGAVDGPDVALGLVIGSDGAVRAYLCGGAYTRSSWTRWLKGSADPDGLLAEAGDWSVRATFDEDDNLTGTVEGPVGTYSFTLAVATEVAGLYTAAEEEPCPSGLVIWQGANGLTAQGAWCRDGVFGQVEPVAPITLRPEGVEIRYLGSHDRFPKGATAWFTPALATPTTPPAELPEVP